MCAIRVRQPGVAAQHAGVTPTELAGGNIAVVPAVPMAAILDAGDEHGQGMRALIKGLDEACAYALAPPMDTCTATAAQWNNLDGTLEATSGAAEMK